MTDSGPGRLRLIRGGRDRRIRRGRLEIAIAAGGDRPFPVQAVVEEEDTFQVLSAPIGPVEDPSPRDHPIRLMTELWAAEPLTPGSVVWRDGVPPKLLAVVHDLDREPTWREPWIAAALERSMAIVRHRGIESLAIPPLGHRHGRMAIDRSADLLVAALREAPPCLGRIWLEVEDSALGPWFRAIEKRI